MPHKVQMSSQLIFSGDCVYSWNIVDSLMKMHAYECMGGYQSISPANIPFSRKRLLDHFQSHTICNLPNHRIMSYCIKNILRPILMMTLSMSGLYVRLRSILGAFTSSAYESSSSGLLFYEC